MPPIIMRRGLIDLSTRMPLSIARLSASAPSSHDLSLAAFTINIAESNFRHTQVEDLSAKPRSGFVVPTIDFKLPYGFVIVWIDRRGLVLINVTTNCDGGVDRTPDHGGL